MALRPRPDKGSGKGGGGGGGGGGGRSPWNGGPSTPSNPSQGVKSTKTNLLIRDSRPHSAPNTPNGPLANGIEARLGIVKKNRRSSVSTPLPLDSAIDLTKDDNPESRSRINDFIGKFGSSDGVKENGGVQKSRAKSLPADMSTVKVVDVVNAELLSNSPTKCPESPLSPSKFDLDTSGCSFIGMAFTPSKTDLTSISSVLELVVGEALSIQGEEAGSPAHLLSVLQPPTAVISDFPSPRNGGMGPVAAVATASPPPASSSSASSSSATTTSSSSTTSPASGSPSRGTSSGVTTLPPSTATTCSTNHATAVTS